MNSDRVQGDRVQGEPEENDIYLTWNMELGLKKGGAIYLANNILMATNNTLSTWQTLVCTWNVELRPKNGGTTYLANYILIASKHNTLFTW